MKVYRIFSNDREHVIEADEIIDEMKNWCATGLRLRRNGQTIAFFDSVKYWIELDERQKKIEKNVDEAFTQFSPS